MKHVAFIALFCGLHSVGCEKKTADDVVLLDYGSYQASAVISGMQELGGEPKLSRIIVHELDETTNTVRAVSGTCFGFRLDGNSLPSPCHIKLEYEHPPFMAPHDRDPTIETVESEGDVNKEMNVDVVWWFDDKFEYELVAGDWTFRAFVDGELVGEKTFDVVE